MRNKNTSLSVILTAGLILSGVSWPGSQELSPNILPPTEASAAEGSTGNTAATDKGDAGYTFNLYTDSESKEQKAQITGYTGTDWNLVIPRNVQENGQEIPVGAIGAAAFKENANITSVTFPDGVTIEIGKEAFYKCPKLTSVSLSSDVTWKWNTKPSSSSPEGVHEGYNFAECPALKDVSLGDGITVLPEHIFENCTALKSIRLPSKLEFFENTAFQNCTSLTALEIPEGVQEMGRSAFKGCTSLTKVAIPSSIQRWCISEHLTYSNHAQIENEAFRDCTALEEVTFAEGLNSVGQYSFTGTAIKTVTIPSTVSELKHAFLGCEKLEEVILKYGALKLIGVNSFYECKALKSIFIPNCVTEIGQTAFGKCDSLKTLIVPPSVTKIGGDTAIDHGSSIENAYFLAPDIETKIKVVPYCTARKIYCQPDSSFYQTYMNIAQKNDWEKDRVVPLTPDVLTLALLNVSTEGYAGTYDAKPHLLASVKDAWDTDQLTCRLLENGKPTGETLTKIPEITEPGSYDLQITLTRFGVSYTGTVQAKILKKAAAIKLKDMTVKEKTNWQVTPEKYEGESDITYTYYQDAAGKIPCSGKPAAAGVYYVKAAAKESAHYIAATSNIAKITIQKNSGNVQPSAPSVKKATLSKVKSPKKKTLEIRWKKVAGAKGYVLWIAQNKKFTRGKKAYTIKSGKTTKKMIKKLKRKKKYYVKIKAYTKANGKKYSGAFSKVKSVKIK